MSNYEDPTVWNVTLSATLRQPSKGAGVIEAHVTVPVHPSEIGQALLDRLAAAAESTLTAQEIEDQGLWGV